MHRTDHTARAETLYLLCAAPIGVPARAGHQPSRSCRLDSVARSAKGRPSLQMQPNDYGRHRLVAGRNVLGVYLVGTLVAEDSQRQPYNGPQDSSASAEKRTLPYARIYAQPCISFHDPAGTATNRSKASRFAAADSRVSPSRELCVLAAGRAEVGIDLAGDVTLQAADDLRPGFPFGRAAPGGRRGRPGPSPAG
jgi:hypothetical protein